MTGATSDELWPLIKNFHYSRRMPSSIVHAFAWRESSGLFGDFGEPKAGIIYSHPVARNSPNNMFELARLVRHDKFDKQLSQFVSWSLRWLKKNTDIHAVLSYADTTQGHHGGIYQATNFTYVKESPKRHIGFQAEDQSFWHCRSCNAKFGTSSTKKMALIKPSWEPIYGKEKYLYIYPLKKKLRTILQEQGWKALSYPKPDKDISK